jgi:glutamate--cysteine ligase
MQNDNIEIKSYIYDIIKKSPEKIDNWFDEKYSRTPKLFYSSVDLRYSGYKISPVDTNLFPAGFNLLSEGQAKKASEKVTEYFNDNLQDISKIILIAENHTRNKFYLENIHSLSKIIENAGLQVKVGNFSDEIEGEFSDLETASGKSLRVYKLNEKSGSLFAGDFQAEAVLVNNDLSAGSPKELENLGKISIFPPIGLGWYRRRKSNHFETYDAVSREFARDFGFDHWLISSVFNKCGKVNFKEREGLECVAENIDKTLWKIKEKYKEYSIKEEPYVYIKANSGTYGMGIMTAKSGSDVIEINKKIRKNMNIIKEGVQNSDVVIQEGIRTLDKVDGHSAEPLVYLVNADAVGCTYRINDNKDAEGNLNSRGMSFKNFEDVKETSNSSNCPVQSLIAKLASLAAARECYEENWTI